MTDVDSIDDFEGQAPATSAGRVGLTPVIGLRQATPRRVANVEAEFGNYRRETGAPREVAVQTPPIELFRWASLAVGAILAAGDLRAAIYIGGILLLLYAGFRTLRPISLTASPRVALYGYIGADDHPELWGGDGAITCARDLLAWL